MAHWKKLQNPDYLGAYSLYDEQMAAQDLPVTITSVSREKVVGQDGKKDDCIVARLQGQKPMILNATNCKTLTKLFGTPDTNGWVGKPFTVYVANIRISGEPTDCLRIRETLPVPTKEVLTDTHPMWAEVVKAVADGSRTIEQLQAKKFIISEEVKQKLVDAAATF